MPARLIYLFGIDGSGKTAAAEQLEQRLTSEQRSVRRVWASLRPVILWPAIKVAKFLLVRRHSKYSDYSRHMTAKEAGVRRFHVLLKPLFYLSLLDYYPQYLWKVVMPAETHDDLICDRYYVDMLMERAILQGVTPEGFCDWLRRYGRFFRTPDLALYLNASPVVAIARKTDIPAEEYLRERTRYFDVAAQALHARVIDADQPLQLVLAQVLECVAESHA